MTPSRGLATAAYAASGLVLLAVAILLLVAEPRYSALALVGDDAGYYLHLARNYCLGFGFSFDRLQPTNGFNPLYPWLLIPSLRALGGAASVDASYRLGVLLSLVAALGGLWAFARLVRGFLAASSLPGDARHALTAAAIGFYVLFVCTKSYYGMDAQIVLLAGNLYLGRVLGRGLLDRGARSALIDGGLLGLAFLARVDSLPLVVAALGLAAIAALGDRGAWRAWAARLLVFAALVAPYIVWGTARFGTWLPISARIKSSFPVASIMRSLDTIRNTSLNAADQAAFLAAFVLAVAVLVRLIVRLAARGRSAADRRAAFAGRAGVLGLLATYLAMRLGYMLLFSRNDVQGSYVILAHVFNALVLVAAAGEVAARSPSPARVAVGVGAAWLAFGLLLFAGKLQVALDRWHRMAAGAGVDDVTLGREIGRRTHPTDVIYGGSFGVAGFFADRAWVNGDGVINTLGYQEAIRDHRLREHLAGLGVTHVVFVRAPGDTAAGPISLRIESGVFGGYDTLVVDLGEVSYQTPALRGGAVALAPFHP